MSIIPQARGKGKGRRRYALLLGVSADCVRWGGSGSCPGRRPSLLARPDFARETQHGVPISDRKTPETIVVSGVFTGSGRRIRTLTNRVRVCRATLTQSRCMAAPQMRHPATCSASLIGRDLLYPAARDLSRRNFRILQKFFRARERRGHTPPPPPEERWPGGVGDGAAGPWTPLPWRARAASWRKIIPPREV